MNEWDYNSGLARAIAWRLGACGWRTVIIDTYRGSTYADAMTDLAGELSGHEPRAAIELHFNAFSNTAARGHEWLYGDDDGLALAQALDDAFRSRITEIPARGIKKLTTGANGWLFVSGAPCPAVIGEPFFGSNADDWAVGQDTERIASAYTAGITTWLGSVCVPTSSRRQSAPVPMAIPQ
jgi:N-acetylmuramoyl-L-alanine amidase